MEARPRQPRLRRRQNMNTSIMPPPVRPSHHKYTSPYPSPTPPDHFKRATAPLDVAPSERDVVPPSTGECVCYWKNKVESSVGTKFLDSAHHAQPAPTTWCQLRTRIENVMCVHKRRATKSNPQGTYLVGYRANPADSSVGAQLTSNDVLQPGDCIVVKRQPVDADTLREHTSAMQRKTPDATQSPSKWVDMTEDERLDAVLNTGVPMYLGDFMTARDRAKSVEQPAEDLHAICRACGRKGHSERWCKHKVLRGFVPLWRRRAPSGIPKHRLRLALEEEYDTAFLTLDGQLVVDREALPKRKCE